MAVIPRNLCIIGTTSLFNRHDHTASPVHAKSLEVSVSLHGLKRLEVFLQIWPSAVHYAWDSMLLMWFNTDVF